MPEDRFVKVNLETLKMLLDRAAQSCEFDKCWTSPGHHENGEKIIDQARIDDKVIDSMMSQIEHTDTP